MRLVTLLTLLVLVAGTLPACRSKGPAADETTEPLTEDPPADADGDGYDTAEDCDDGASATFPGAPEICDGVDNDCDGAADEEVGDTFYADADADEFGDEAASTEACEAPEGYAAVGGDCDDGDPSAYPGAAERCDEADNDCDGATDEDVTSAWYADADGDGYGDPEAAAEGCDPDEGYIADNSDCDDTDAAVYPSGLEVCDEADNDCDGAVDEGVTTTFYADEDGDGFGLADETAESCDPLTGYADLAGDCDDAEPGVNPAAAEVCDGVDDDCDGDVDEGVTTTYYADEDSDGFGDASSAVQACAAPAGYVADAGDCDDADAARSPDTTWYADSDGDGYGGASALTQCLEPAGYVSGSSDCDDDDDDVHPGAIESCNAADDDCDGQADEAGAEGESTFYADEDGDGFGDAGSAVQACAAPAGYVADDADCDDDVAGIHPGAAESCNAADDDCDGDVDEGVTSAWYADEDGDGFGDASSAVQACAAPAGYVADDADCDDADDHANPAGVEVCDDADNDCDGQADENSAADAPTWYADADEDGYGDGAASQAACAAPAGYIAGSGDCDDAEPGINPAAVEVCDGLDNNCAAGADEGSAADAPTWYTDADLDGYGAADTARASCAAPEDGGEWVGAAGDCDDADPDVNPLEAEECDSIDNDCDGTADNDEAVLGSTAGCPAESCDEILTLRSDAPDGTYYVSPAGGAAVEVRCEMDIDGGGWTQARQGYVSALPSGVTREYLYSYGSAWYRSPPTTAIWSWSSYQALDGSYAYSAGSLTATGSFACSHGESGHWGVGCSNGPGGQLKVLPIYSASADQGTSTICQDKPDVFGAGACRTGAQIWVRP